jgi:hypothetical protein
MITLQTQSLLQSMNSQPYAITKPLLKKSISERSGLLQELNSLPSTSVKHAPMPTLNFLVSVSRKGTIDPLPTPKPQFYQQEQRRQHCLEEQHQLFIHPYWRSDTMPPLVAGGGVRTSLAEIPRIVRSKTLSGEKRSDLRVRGNSSVIQYA